MSLYDTCVQLLKTSSDVIPSGSYPAPLRSKDCSLAVVSDAKKSGHHDSSIYYISDIHLVHHIQSVFPNGASDEEVATYVHSVVHGLFKGEFLEDVRQFNNPVVLFCGDISSSFVIAELFFKEFAFCWDDLETREREKVAAELKRRNSVVMKWEEKHSGQDGASDRPEQIAEAEKLISKLKSKLDRYERKNSGDSKKRGIYAILGNHEFWDFDSADACVTAYRKMFDALGICFLHNNACWFYRTSLPRFARNEHPERYDRYMRASHNAIIVGGTGFAGRNSTFNADNGIYQFALTRPEEIKETQKWLEIYKRSIEISEEHQCIGYSNRPSLTMC